MSESFERIPRGEQKETLREMMDRSTKETGTIDLFELEENKATAQEIRAITENKRDVNFLNWLPKLAEIAQRGEIEAAMVAQEVYRVGNERGHAAALEEGKEEAE